MGFLGENLGWIVPDSVLRVGARRFRLRGDVLEVERHILLHLDVVVSALFDLPTEASALLESTAVINFVYRLVPDAWIIWRRTLILLAFIVYIFHARGLIHIRSNSIH